MRANKIFMCFLSLSLYFTSMAGICNGTRTDKFTTFVTYITHSHPSNINAISSELKKIGVANKISITKYPLHVKLTHENEFNFSNKFAFSAILLMYDANKLSSVHFNISNKNCLTLTEVYKMFGRFPEKHFVPDNPYLYVREKSAPWGRYSALVVIPSKYSVNSEQCVSDFVLELRTKEPYNEVRGKAKTRP